MLESVSPYLLLRASIPRQNASATPYDLYSLAQSRPLPNAQPGAGMQSALNPIKDTSVREGFKASEAQATAPAASDDQASAMPQSQPQLASFRPAIPVRRTHYIADIKTRHSAAAKHTTFTQPSQS